MKCLLIIATMLTVSFSAFAAEQCGKQDPSNEAKLSGSKAMSLYNSMDPMTAKNGADSLGRVWFTEKSKSVELSECTVSDCTYTRSRVSRCVKAYNGQVDCLERDETAYYCIDYR